MWRGDHVELYLDAAPQAEPQRNTVGQGQIHLGFSPGNFRRTGDHLTDIGPEAVVFSPADGSAEGILVAAQKTEKGYALEAAIPWRLIARLAKTPELKPASGMPLGFEVAISDTDGAESTQEKLMTILATPWAHVRSRLMTAALAPSDGKAPAAVRGLEVSKGLKLLPGKKEQVDFKGIVTPAGKESVLVLKARLATPRASGHNPGMRLWLNGQALDPRRLLNRQHEEVRRDGRMTNRAAGDIFNVCYSPDFDAPDKHPVYALQSGAKLCQFEPAGERSAAGGRQPACDRQLRQAGNQSHAGRGRRAAGNAHAGQAEAQAAGARWPTRGNRARARA